MLTIAKRVFDQVKDCKENIFHNDDKVEIKQARFTVNNKPFEIHYGKFNQKDLEDLHLAVLKSLDKGKISREAYRSLARINQDLPRDGAISNTRQRLNEQMNNLIPLSLINIEQSAISELTIDQSHITDFNIVNNIVESVGKGDQCSIIDLLNFMIPEYIKRGLLIPNNTTIKLLYHIPEFIDIHKDLGLMAFSCSALEKKTIFKKSAVLEILEHENRQLFF
ncbi:7705_t:CDS:2 [Racocetra fulgida]|uniref:7705_t:CDS:1 n=1 Tax=Racocetra fulgida TaxID=60492 RepID=A0A9N9DET5_9GLOM|nr:7705_t:CDS:2 [Racocetra fulgida]